MPHSHSPKRIRDGDATALPQPWSRRIPWTPVVISILVVLSSGLAVQPVRDARTLTDVAEAYLLRPMTYVAIAPLSNVLDTLSLLSGRQHIALVLGVIVLFALRRLVRALRDGATWRAHLVATALLVVGIVVAYVAAAVLPRPMASLVTDNANILRVDFHSHTSASHDGRGGWGAEHNRAWHRDGGYDAAYVTDHATVSEAERGMANNPNPAGGGVTLLQGIEVTWSGEHVAILGAERRYRGLLTPNLRDVDEQGLLLGSLIQTREPVVIWNHPKDLTRLPPASGPRTAGVRGIEISNGSPPGADKIRPKRQAIVALAERAGLAMMGGSDYHGWGRTAPAWTLVRIFGWRGMNADSLDQQIERVVRESGARGTRVVERRVADPGSRNTALALTVLSVPLRMLTTLSNDERLVWLIWTWLIAATVWWVRRRRARGMAS
ncbi:MAG: hypothetical protein WD825_03675 [Gemmatimonadaceae bacterium]